MSSPPLRVGPPFLSVRFRWRLCPGHPERSRARPRPPRLSCRRILPPGPVPFSGTQTGPACGTRCLRWGAQGAAFPGPLAPSPSAPDAFSGGGLGVRARRGEGLGEGGTTAGRPARSASARGLLLPPLTRNEASVLVRQHGLSEPCKPFRLAANACRLRPDAASSRPTAGRYGRLTAAGRPMALETARLVCLVTAFGRPDAELGRAVGTGWHGVAGREGESEA